MKNLQAQLDELRAVLQAVVDYVGNQQVMQQMMENAAKAAKSQEPVTMDGAAIQPAEENKGTVPP